MNRWKSNKFHLTLIPTDVSSFFNLFTPSDHVNLFNERYSVWKERKEGNAIDECSDIGKITLSMHYENSCSNSVRRNSIFIGEKWKFVFIALSTWSVEQRNVHISSRPIIDLNLNWYFSFYCSISRLNNSLISYIGWSNGKLQCLHLPNSLSIWITQEH